MSRRRATRHALLLAIPVLSTWLAWGGVGNTGHDLTPRSESRVGRSNEAGVCVYCHIPHSARPTRALWNRRVSGVTYTLYESSTLQAEVRQPTGSSRLCLSCHDGTIAMETPRTGRRVGGDHHKPLRGRKVVGLDLSDDHPISFLYDATIATRKEELLDPSLLPSRVRLDREDQMQCTTCHDAHEDRTADFLVVENRFSNLCTSCHRMQDWDGSVHALSQGVWNGVAEDPWPHSEFETVAENGCANCHRSHAAGQPEWLLQYRDEEDNCFVCHAGTVADANIEAEFQKISVHPVLETQWLHEPGENPGVMRRHVTCSDCHDPHSVQALEAASSNVPTPAVLGGVAGVSASGARVNEAAAAYEICYACHGLAEQPQAAAVRADHVTNARLEFDPANASYHPVVAPGKNPDVPDLETGLTPSSLVTCTDCHNSDSMILPGGLRGPHGSIYEPILEREYQMIDPSLDSAQSYALCYKCHNRSALLGNPRGFPHRLHVEQGHTSCAVCHDAHGSRRNSHLINFMLRDRTGAVVVSPASNGLLQFEDLGVTAGNCSLACHGVDHAPLSYP